MHNSEKEEEKYENQEKYDYDLGERRSAHLQAKGRINYEKNEFKQVNTPLREIYELDEEEDLKDNPKDEDFQVKDEEKNDNSNKDMEEEEELRNGRSNFESEPEDEEEREDESSKTKTKHDSLLRSPVDPYNSEEDEMVKFSPMSTDHDESYKMKGIQRNKKKKTKRGEYELNEEEDTNQDDTWI
ncbi:uncharacterized protein LOC131058817 [Cryptomeria japonica]|uniref:uncharacterized protein LOC131058817 n=1 Tax=Cryptomeria japonica TaxID=3369 RepID=UPI0027DA1E61|nr:uncharacterized protein LOC131058817 [Cryptomeria japonica]